jgi:TfoX/Sxy family transcriptional regulator of competence genes
MAYDPGLVERVADALPSLGAAAARQKGMFGGRGFMVGKHTFAIVFDDDLIVKAPKAEYEAALAERGVTAFAPGGDRPMSTWVVVSGEAIADDPELSEWLGRGLRAVR